MRNLAGLCAVVCFGLIAVTAGAQGSAPATLSPRTHAKTADKKPADEKKDAPATATPKEAITTEIYADEAFFDSAKSIGIFTKHVVVNDPRFNIQGDKLTIYLGKKENEGLEKAIVEGNVAVVRDRPEPAGSPPSRMVGRSDKAVYTAKDGGFELTGSPRVQQGLNTHVATSPDTVMILNEAGELTTHGPSRTEIRQEPKTEPPKP